MAYSVVNTDLPEVLILEPEVFGDLRGYFYESFSTRDFEAATGLSRNFVQDNHSRSKRGVLRGLHYQIKCAQGKLVRVTEGEVFDVAVDIRRGSPNFGKWTGARLSAENNRQLWVPEGFAHGFLVLSDWAQFLYKTTDYYAAEHERCIRWDDSSINVNWPTEQEPILSVKDQQGVDLDDADTFVYTEAAS